MDKLAKKLLINVTISAVIIAAVISLGFNPIIKNIEATTQQIKLQKIELEKLKNKIGEQEAEQYKSLRTEIPNLEKAIVTENNIISFVESLETAAAASKVTQTINLNPDTSKKSSQSTTPVNSTNSTNPASKNTANSKTTLPEQKANKVNYEIKIVGTFPAFMDYLKRMENIYAFTNVKIIDVKKVGEGDTIEALLKCEVDLQKI